MHEHGGKQKLVCYKLSQTINTRAADIKRKGREKVGQKDKNNDDYQGGGDDKTSIGLQNRSDSD